MINAGNENPWKERRNLGWSGEMICACLGRWRVCDVQWRHKCTNHLHQCSVCDPSALEILDEVHQSNPVNPLEDCWESPDKMHSFQSPRGALQESNKYSQIVFIECSLII